MLLIDDIYPVSLKLLENTTVKLTISTLDGITINKLFKIQNLMMMQQIIQQQLNLN